MNKNTISSFIAKYRPPVVSVIQLYGTIGMGGKSLSDHRLSSIIERAFTKGKPHAVALMINSPGGSPVQSSLIASRIRRLADKHSIPVHAFVEDIAASGGYWLATAADHIWADPSSILGSIGVISSSFGFQDLIARHGIERRVHTAGKSKSLADPFKPERPEDVKRIKALLMPLHETFINQVKERRQDRLAQDADIFNADIWVGQKAVDLGLADGLAHAKPKLQELYGDKVRLRVYSMKKGMFGRFNISLGAELTSAALTAADERALWARYGL